MSVPGPLNGFRVVEVAQFAAGPVVGMLLADLGAEVIKVEPPQGDPTRSRGLYDVRGQPAYFMYFNRGKRSVVLDVKKPEALAAVHDLVRNADVFLSNLRPGKLEKMGLDYPTLAKVNPRVVACSVTGFGAVGPQRDRPAVDGIPQAMGGIMSITGEPQRPPVLAGAPVADLGAGMFAAMGVLAALLERHRTGVGQHVDVSMLDAVVWFVGYPAAYYLASGNVPGPMGSGHENASPYGAYATADGRYVFVAAQHSWEALCNMLGRADLLADPRFLDRNSRLAHHTDLNAILAGEFRKATAAEWLERLADADIPASPVNNLADVYADPLVIARGMRTEVRHPDGGTFASTGNPVKLSGSAPGMYEAPPLFGADTEAVLRDIAGYDTARISRLAGKTPA